MPTRNNKTLWGAALGLLLVGLGIAADVSGVINFTTGLTLPQILKGDSPTASSTPQQGSVPTDASANGGAGGRTQSREPKSSAPRPRKAIRPPTPSSTKPKAIASEWPSHDQIVQCLDQRYFDGYSSAVGSGLKASDVGDRVTVKIHIDATDQTYTFWHTDKDCNAVKVFRISPGQDRSYIGWGGGLWDMERGSHGPAFEGPGPFSRKNSESRYTFEVGRTTVTYSFAG